MYKLVYAPKALDDLQNIKDYTVSTHGVEVAKRAMKKLTSTARNLERFSEEGPNLGDLIQVSTDYRYLYVKPNYLFYRIEGDTIKIVRVLNEKQNFMQILFGININSDEEEAY